MIVRLINAQGSVHTLCLIAFLIYCVVCYQRTLIRTSKGKLSIKDQLLLVLIKLRTGAPNKNLAYRFGVSPGRVFHEWVDILSHEPKKFIVWPDQEVLRKTLPQCYQA